MLKTVILTTLALVSITSAQACELYPGGVQDPVCVSMRAAGQSAVPAPRPYWSAPDRCTRHDGAAYGGNTNWACVPPSARVGNGYQDMPNYTMGQANSDFSTVVRTPSGSYMVRGSAGTISSYRIR